MTTQTTSETTKAWTFQSEKCSSSSESRRKPEFDVGTMIGEKYKIVSELGRGGCGVVYKVEFEQNEHLKCAALKIEYVLRNYSETLAAEANVLRKLQWSKNVCRLFDAGRVMENMNVVIMSLAGPSLSWLRRHCPQQRMSFSTALRIAFYCMNASLNIFIYENQQFLYFSGH